MKLTVNTIHKLAPCFRQIYNAVCQKGKGGIIF